MPEKKLICPFCGHDGTREAARTAVESHGFNYLQDDVVCRDVRGYDAEGRIQLAREFKCEGVPGTNPRIECRACWQTFPLPEGVEWVLSATEVQATVGGAPPETPPLAEAAAEPGVPPLAGDYQPLAQRMTEDVVRILKMTVEEVRRLATDDLKTAVETVAGVSAQIEAVRGDVAGVREEVGLLRETDKEFSFRLARVEDQLRGHEEIYSKTQDEVQKIAAAQEETRQGLGGGLEALDRRLQEHAASAESLGAAWVRLDDSHGTLQKRLDALDERLKEQAASTEGLNAAWSKLEEGRTAIEKRLEAQAEAIRTVHVATQTQAGRREELRAALEKLEEIASGLNEPKPLPHDL